MQAPFDMTGKTVLVTGASSGLGLHFAHVLAKAGARVALAARRRERLEQEAQVMAPTGTAAAVAMDVTDSRSVADAFDAAEQALGPVDVLVNNAGIALGKPLLDIEDDDWSRVVETNLTGAWTVAREAARRMRGDGGGQGGGSGRGGVIVNIASILGLRAIGGVAPYAASKAALVHLTRVMALELAPHAIRVNALAPGYVETDLNRAFLQSRAGERLRGRIPQGRFGTMSDLEGPILLLASEASAYMSGSVLTVDGGHMVSSL